MFNECELLKMKKFKNPNGSLVKDTESNKQQQTEGSKSNSVGQRSVEPVGIEKSVLFRKGWQ